VTVQQPASPKAPLVLVTGATGYIGGRLVPVLEGAGVCLRCLARRPAALASGVSQTTEVVAGDLFDPGCHSIAPSRARPESCGPHSRNSLAPFGRRPASCGAPGFVPLPPLFVMLLLGITGGYLVASELVKGWFFRRCA
jgi:hypothetical protein